MGIDPAYGSSAFGIVVTAWADGIVKILFAEEYHRPDYNEMLSTVYGLMSKYDVDAVYVDGQLAISLKCLDECLSKIKQPFALSTYGRLL